MNLSLFLVLGALGAASVSAQEVLAVDFAGNAFAVGATARLIGPTGVTGCNAMAVQNGVYYVSARSGSSHQLATLDPFTAQATVRFPNLGVDLRGLADSSNPGELFGVVNALPADRLVRIDLTTGAVTNVGSTGRTGIQALARLGSMLWAWDVTAGLLAMSPVTGATFDPFPFAGAAGVDIQFLCVSFGALRGGNHRMYSLSTSNGVATATGGELGTDLRGGEPRLGAIVPFGTGCSTGGFGTTLACTGPALAGTSLFFTANDHTPGAAALLYVSDTQVTTPLPPLSCSLLVGFSTPMALTLSNEGKLNLGLPLPAVFGVEHFFQLQVLEVAPLLESLTNAIRVRVPF